MTARRVVLVRHGETAWNREGRFQGQTDIPLSEVGREQARALRLRLAKHPELFDEQHTAVLTSDLKRAHETAELAFGGNGRVLHVRRALRELCYGVFEGFTRPEIDARFPGAMAAWLRGDPAFAVEGGESRAQVQARARAAIHAFLDEVEHPTVVVVAHGGVMRQLLAPLFPQRAELAALGFGNTSTHAVDIERGAGRWRYFGAL